VIFRHWISTKYYFQVSQGSVETLLRWSGKRSHYFAAILFQTLCTNFIRINRR